MSVFNTVILTCPSCQEQSEFDALYSINADRRPDLRAAVIDGSLQVMTCKHCGSEFRLDPDMTYVDTGKGDWIAVHPASAMGDWERLEEEADQTFATAYGDAAGPAAQSIGAGLVPRMVFGWGALREKFVAADAGLDDVELELLKMAMLRSVDKMPVSAESELRLVEIDAESGDLVMAWIVAQDERIIEMMKVPRELYDEIKADKSGWKALRDQVSGGMFVDMSRLLVGVA